MKKYNKTILISSVNIWTIINFRKNLIKILSNLGFKIIIATYVDIDTKNYLFLKNTKIINLNISNRNLTIIENIKLFLSYIRIFYQHKPDYYFSFTIKPNIIGSLSLLFYRKIIIVNNITGLGATHNYNYIFKKVIDLLYKIALSNSELVLFQNLYSQNLFLKKKLLNHKTIFKLIPGSGVDLNHFKFLQKTKKNKNLNFYFCGRLINEKGIRIFIEAAKVILKTSNNVNFFIVGYISPYKNDIDLNYLKEIERTYNIKYLGNFDDIRQILYKCDCLVLPSYYNEGVPRILIEAASCGLPLISTDHPGCNDIVIDGYNGFLCKIKSKDSLINCIKKIIELDETDYLRFCLNSRNLVEKSFNEEIILNVYKNIVTNKIR